MRLDPAHFRFGVGNAAPRTPFALKRASPQARGLAACWPLFAGPGLGLRDLSGNGAHLTLGATTETPSWVKTAAFNAHALDFDGGDEAHVAAGNIGALDLTSEITISVWVRPDNLGDANGLRIVSKRTTVGGSDVYALFLLDSGTPQVWFRIGGSDLVWTVTLATAVWHHIAATYKSGERRIYHNGALVASDTQTGSIATSTRGVYLGHREGETRYLDGSLADARIYGRALAMREVRAIYDPQTRWAIYREEAVPRVWPKAAGGGVTTRTGIGSLQAVLQHQASLLASTDAALRAEAAVSALAGAALAQIASRNASLELAVQAVRQAQADLDTALIRTLGREAGLDANLTVQGASQRSGALDGAIRRLNLLSGALEAVLRASAQGSAALDAWIALNLAGTAGLDAIAMRRGQFSDTALQGVLRATPDRAAALDAVIGLVISAATSRTQSIGARETVAGGLRGHVIPSGNRRH